MRLYVVTSCFPTRKYGSYKAKLMSDRGDVLRTLGGTLTYKNNEIPQDVDGFKKVKIAEISSRRIQIYRSFLPELNPTNLIFFTL